MSEPKAFASLSSGLLARKGAAKPAMRPQGFGQMGASLEDLGWNDMGFEAPRPSVATQPRDADHDAFGDAVAASPLRNPVSQLTPSPVHNQQAEIAARFAETQDEEPEGDEFDNDIEAEPEFGVPAGSLVATPRWADDVQAEGPEPGQAVVLALKPVAPVPAESVETERVDAEPAPIVRLAPTPRVARGAGPRAAFTLRLDEERHLRLRLACALTGRSAQMLVTEAVDKLLLEFPELEKFAGELPEGKRRRAKG